MSAHTKKYSIQFFSAICILFITFNMRGNLVSYSPLIESLRSILDISLSQFSLISALPLFCFGLFALCVPRLSRSFSSGFIVSLAIFLVFLGCLLRSISSYNIVLLGTVLLGSGIAILNVLIPGIIRELFSNHIQKMMGLYTVCVGLSATVGAFIPVPFVDYTGQWNAPFIFWTFLGACAFVFWILLLRVQKPSTKKAVIHIKSVSLFRNPRAWTITLCMGLQSGLFYTLVAWLPAILADAGYSKLYAGNILTLINIASIPSGFIIPYLCNRFSSQSWIAPIIVICYSFMWIGFISFPHSYPILWALLGGIGTGAALSFSLYIMIIRVRSYSQLISLSAMSQSIGYLIAAMWPWIIGQVYVVSGSWTIPLYCLLIVVVFLGITAWLSGRNIFLSAEDDE